MNENPFQSPQVNTDVASNVASIEGLRRVAGYQRAVIICVLIELLYIPFNLFLREASPRLNLLLAFVILAVVLGGAVYLFLLAKVLYGTGTAVFMAILSLVPCLGLLLLLRVNAAATALLRQNGIRVGLMGADTKQL